MYKFIGGIFNQLYYIDLFKVTFKMLWLVQPEQLTTELLVSYLIILQMNFALTMTSDRLMGSVDPSFSWGMRKG